MRHKNASIKKHFRKGPQHKHNKLHSDKPLFHTKQHCNQDQSNNE